jgi:hypothetical protein
MYYFNGSKWIRAEYGSSSTYSPISMASSSLKLFNFFRMQDTYGDPNGPSTVINPITFTATATGATGTLKYQWYKKGFTPSGDIKISGATTNIYTTPAGLTAWGLNSYYCVITDENNTSVASPPGEIAIGCGAKTVDGGWLKFMCYNLGADTSLDPFTWKSDGDDVDNDIKGYLYQWGRQSDGHQMRNSATCAGPYTGPLDNEGQIPASQDYAYGKFITNPEDVNAWCLPRVVDAWSPDRPSGAPCPTGWRLPTVNETMAMQSARIVYLSEISSNVCTWEDGIVFRQMGTSDATLYIPAAGRRMGDGSLYVDISWFYIYGAKDEFGKTGAVWVGKKTEMQHSSGSWLQQGFPVRCLQD